MDFTMSVYSLVCTDYFVCARLGSEGVHIFRLLKSWLQMDGFQWLCNFERLTRDLTNAASDPDYYAVCNFFLTHASPPYMYPFQQIFSTLAGSVWFIVLLCLQTLFQGVQNNKKFQAGF
jgi:hypothetical protein